MTETEIEIFRELQKLLWGKILPKKRGENTTIKLYRKYYRDHGWGCWWQGTHGYVPPAGTPSPMDTHLPPLAMNPQQPSASDNGLTNSITFSNCSLVSSSIFRRNMAPLTISNLRRRGCWHQSGEEHRALAGAAGPHAAAHGSGSHRAAAHGAAGSRGNRDGDPPSGRTLSSAAAVLV